MYNDPQDFRKRKGKLLLLIPVVIFLVSGLVMFLWNAILPDLLGLKHITYWQAAGLLVLCKILFGGFGFAKKHHGPGAGFREKWMKSAEEREKIRDEWRKRCGQWKAGQ